MNLFVRLSLVFLATLLVLGGFTLWIAERSARSYFLEFTQRLNAPIAMYMAENAGLVIDGELDQNALSSLAEHVMMINPSVEVYVLDLEGRVMAQASNANVIAQPRVSMRPILEAIRLNPVSDSGAFAQAVVAVEMAAEEPSTESPTLRAGTLLGDNPLDADDQRPFSAYPLRSDGHVIGYIYALLAGREHQTLLSAIRSSHSLRDLAWTLACVLVLAGLAGSVVFFSLTQRLRGLTRRVQAASGVTGKSVLGTTLPMGRHSQQMRRTHDEIDELTTAYDAMAQQLQAQCQSLAEQDRIRRELVANISHDLRTPLTTLQGYLETLLMKRGNLDKAAEYRYLAIAHKHSVRLRLLVSKLFELSKLDSGEFELNCEVFSFLELALDAMQDITRIADERKIVLEVRANNHEGEPLDVNADIALVHRALENLLDNALRYTAPGGHIAIEVSRRDDERIGVVVVDDGEGMQDSDARRAFEPRFRADTEGSDRSDGDPFGHAGLGLAIVRSIAKLHGSDMSLDTKPGCGARFEFSLPTQFAASERTADASVQPSQVDARRSPQLEKSHA